MQIATILLLMPLLLYIYLITVVSSYFNMLNISSKVLFGGGYVTFFEGICSGTHRELVPMRVIFNNADYYLENIVVEHVKTFALFVGCYFILMDRMVPPSNIENIQKTILKVADFH